MLKTSMSSGALIAPLYVGWMATSHFWMVLLGVDAVMQQSYHWNISAMATCPEDGGLPLARRVEFSSVVLAMK